LFAYFAELLKPAAKLALPLIIWGITVHSLVVADFWGLALAGASLFLVGGLASLAFLAEREEREALARLLRRHARPN
jgi:hypothetical protein